MAITIPTCNTDTEVIQQLGDLPNVDNSLTADELKAKFDSAPTGLKRFLNETLRPVLSSLVSVVEAHSAALNNPHNTTYTQVGADAAGAAAAVGSNLNTHTANGTIHVTEEDKTEWSAKQDALAENQIRHIFAQSTEPEGAQPGDIWFVMPEPETEGNQ